MRTLAADLSRKRAVYADKDSDPDNVILAIAIRHFYTFEMEVPKTNFDSLQLLALVDKAGLDDIH
jgi:hypothetical protein